MLTNGYVVKAVVFPVVKYRCESWIIKKTEHQIIDVFNSWCWRRHLRVSCTVRRSNQTVLNEINPEYSLERLMLKLKLQYFGHLMWRTNSSEKTLMLGKIDSKRRRGWQRTTWLDGITELIDINLSKLREIVETGEAGVLQSTRSRRVGQTWHCDWTIKIRSQWARSLY